jgi:5-formyltetrahydrofolate cyclo-ligase
MTLALTDRTDIKRQMRERIRAERRATPAARRVADAEALARVALEVPEIANASCVALYESTDDTPGTGPLRRRLGRAGVRVLLPVLLGDGHLDWIVDGPADPARAEVLGLEGIGEAQVVVVPALAVDTLGNRLGQGFGFYDRTLRMIDDWVPVFALLHEGEVLDAAVEPVPAEAHDQPVTAVVTPCRYLRMPPRR